MAEPALKLEMSLDDYLDFEASTDERFEYEDGLLWAMSGETKRHAQLALNATVRLFAAARDRGCRLFPSGVKLHVSETKYYYPDLLVACGPDGEDPSIETSPCFVLEVLSPSTERRDRGVKLEAYLKLASLEQYALVSTEARRVEVYERDGAQWRYRALTGDSALEVRCLGERVSLAALYAGTGPLGQEAD